MFDRLAGERDGTWVIAALRRRWWVIVLVAIVAAAAAYVLGSRQTKQYKASAALLFLNSPLDQELTGKQIVSSNTDPIRQAATNQSLVELLTVSRMVAQQLHLPVGHVRSDVSFGSDAASDVMTVNAVDENRVLAAKIANAYVQQYIQFRKSASINQLNTAENLISSKLAQIPASEQSGAVAQALIGDRNQLDLLKSAQTGDAEVVETAGIPTKASSPSPAKDAGIGLFLGLLLGAALVAVLERRDRRIKTLDEIEAIDGVPVIGTIPESAGLRAGRPATPREEEPFLMIRAQLRYFDVDRHIQRVMITSADPGEGKSLISMNLARAAARTDDKRTLLIEADLRRPSLHTIIGREGVAGLGELLSHSQDLETGLRELVVTPDQLPESDHPVHLDVLLAGASPPNPAELLESRRMEALLEAADSIYDIVIIDTPPIGVVSDAIPLVHQVDGLLVINRMGVSRRDHAQALIKRFRGLNAHILGVVVNSYRAPDDSAYGYYQYSQPGDEDASRRRGRARSRIARTP
jgi:capsular exopolysaccharide synthesis family protein